MNKVFAVFVLLCVAFFSANRASAQIVTSNDSEYYEATGPQLGVSLAPAPLLYQTMRIDFDYLPGESDLAFFIAPQVTIDRSNGNFAMTQIYDYEVTGFGADAGVKYYVNRSATNSFFFGLNVSGLTLDITHPQMILVQSSNPEGIPIFFERQEQDQESTINRITGEVLVGTKTRLSRNFFAELWGGVGSMNSTIGDQKYEGINNDELLGESMYFGYGIFFTVGIKAGVLFDL